MTRKWLREVSVKPLKILQKKGLYQAVFQELHFRSFWKSGALQQNML